MDVTLSLALDISFKVKIESNLLLPERVARGEYDIVDEANITEDIANPTPVSQCEMTIRLVRFSTDLMTPALMSLMNKNRLSFPRLSGLLAFGEQYKNIQLSYHPIITLGTLWLNAHGKIRYPYLGCSDGRRTLMTNTMPVNDEFFSTKCHFLITDMLMAKF